MPDFMSCDDDAAEATGVLDDRHTVDLLEAFVHDARASDIGEACSQVHRPRVAKESVNKFSNLQEFFEEKHSMCRFVTLGCVRVCRLSCPASKWWLVINNQR